ncbi:hypothetical protein IH575_04175, partial [Candidatus Dojkabacteria bacterium]|nr:hypothetical protein [Candidatus Dojkabacteria bacterium]
MDVSVYDQTRVFKFNLVPPKTRQELIVLEERDNSILYSFLLVFFAMLIFFILNLIQTFVINQRIELSEKQIATQESQLDGYDDIRRIHGELITKSELLEPVLRRDIKLTEMLDLSQEIVAKNPGAQIVTYAREATGEFVLMFRLPNVDAATLLVDSMLADSRLSGVFA